MKLNIYYKDVTKMSFKSIITITFNFHISHWIYIFFSWGRWKFGTTVDILYELNYWLLSILRQKISEQLNIIYSKGPTNSVLNSYTFIHYFCDSGEESAFFDRWKQNIKSSRRDISLFREWMSLPIYPLDSTLNKVDLI